MTIEDAICSNFSNARPEDPEKWTKVLSDKIQVAAEDYRVNIDKMLKLHKGNGFGEKGKRCKLAKLTEPKGPDHHLQVH